MPRSLTSAPGSMPVATFVVTIIFTVIVIIAVGLRVLAARMRRRSFKLHDYLIFLALLASIAGCVATGVALYYGALGKHIEDATVHEMVVLLKTLSGSSVLWIVSTASVKASVLCLLWGLFPRKSFRWAVYATGVLVGLFFVGFLIEPFIICVPYHHYWDRITNPDDGWCGNQFTEEIFAASSNMVVDLIIVILPIPVLWSLQMPTGKKIRVNIILSMGLLICGVNISRMIYTVYASQTDFTYSGAYEFILAQMEVWVGIVVACLPLYGPLIHTRKGDKKPLFPSSGFRSTTSSWASKLRLLSFSTRGSRSQGSRTNGQSTNASQPSEFRSDKSTSNNYTEQNNTLHTATTTSTGPDDYLDASQVKEEVYMGQADYQVVQMHQPARAVQVDLDQENHEAHENHEGNSMTSSDKEERHGHEMV